MHSDDDGPEQAEHELSQTMHTCPVVFGYVPIGHVETHVDVVTSRSCRALHDVHCAEDVAHSAQLIEQAAQMLSASAKVPVGHEDSQTLPSKNFSSETAKHDVQEDDDDAHDAHVLSQA